MTQLHDKSNNVHDSPTQTARALGYRMPAEFEEVEAIWLTKPRNPETWPGCFEQAAGQHAALVGALEKVVRVELIGRDHDWSANDSWIRDYGPIFVIDDEGNKACHDFRFNGWGGKYGNEYETDDHVPRLIANVRGLRVWVHDLVLEGGSIEVDGQGTVMTTAQCLLNTNRNPHLSRQEIEHELHEALGTRHIIWLPGGIVGDDTDGHIDDIARFVSTETIVVSRAPAEHADFPMLEKNFQTLEHVKNAEGKKLEIVALPVPDPILYDFPADRFGPAETRPVPASYANFLMVNEAVFVPVFGKREDDEAMKIIERTSGKSVVPIRSEFLVVGLGALHCLSMQEPAGKNIQRHRRP